MKINNQAIHPDQSEDVLKFYTDKYPRVNLVTCEKCEQDLAIEVLIPEKQSKAREAHHDGMTIIPIGNTLLASRKRLDFVMGYECICGNDSRLGEAEKGVLGRGLRNTMPHEEGMVDANLKLGKDKYKPDVSVFNDGSQRVEGFFIKKLK